jgi:hypothetical protein
VFGKKSLNGRIIVIGVVWVMSTQSPASDVLRKAVSPAAARASRLPAAGPATRPLLSDITVEHGPVDLIGRLFLMADTAARQRGVTLSFAPMQDLIDINRANPETWRPILPLFDPACGGITDDNSFCILGHNAQGEVVATQAARLYSWRDTSFHEEASSLRLFYAEPDRLKGEREEVVVTAPAAHGLTGAVIFAGGIWYRPDYRGVGLPYILPWLSRTYAYTRWKHDFSCSIMAEEVYRRGMAQRSGYSKADWEVWLRYTPVDPKGEIRCALVYMDEAELLSGAAGFLARFDAQIDARVDQRRRHQQG